MLRKEFFLMRNLKYSNVYMKNLKILDQLIFQIIPIRKKDTMLQNKAK